jgi:hypothetical protein
MFSKYNFLVRPAMRAIARREQGPDVDVINDRIYTDWNAVEAFVRTFIARSFKAGPIRKVV